MESEAINIIPRDVSKETYESIELFGKPVLFTMMCIDRDTVPLGLYAYDIRHGDSGNPATLEKYVVVNHFGTVILNRPIALTKGDYRRAKLRDFNFGDATHCTLQQYIEKHPPHKPEKDR